MQAAQAVKLMGRRKKVSESPGLLWVTVLGIPDRVEIWMSCAAQGGKKKEELGTAKGRII